MEVSCVLPPYAERETLGEKERAREREKERLKEKRRHVMFKSANDGPRGRGTNLRVGPSSLGSQQRG